MNRLVSRSATAPKKSPTWDVATVASHLTELKLASEEGAAWWSGAISFSFNSLRPGNNGTQWGNVHYTDAHGVSGPLMTRAFGEKQQGLNMPLDEKGCEEMRADKRFAKFKDITPRKGPNVTFNIGKYTYQVDVAEDGITVNFDDEGLPLAKGGKPRPPAEECLSATYNLISLLNEAFFAEVKVRIANGADYIAHIEKVKAADKVAEKAAKVASDAAKAAGQPPVPFTPVAPATIIADFNATRVRTPGDMIMHADGGVTIRRLFPIPAEATLLLKGVNITTNIKIVSMIQEYYSSQATKNAGCAIPNPLTRITFGYNKNEPSFELNDKNDAHVENGRTVYGRAKVDGRPVTINNIHVFLRSCTLDGILDLSTICFSSMGISYLIRCKLACCERIEGAESFDQDDLYATGETAEGGAVVAVPAAARVPVQSAPAAVTAVAAPATVNAAEMSDLLNELTA